LTRFINDYETLNETIANNASGAESAIEELSEEAEQGSLVCN
jgi:hypothetical protein